MSIWTCLLLLLSGVALTQAAAPQSITYPSTSPVYEVGTEISANIPGWDSSIGDDPTSWAVSPTLPDGLNFNMVTGTISG